MKPPKDPHLHKFKLLSRIPRNMLKMYGVDNISEFVLHDLCCQACFNLQKAAYFVDNPAFDCLKGVAGYSKKEAFASKGTIWQEPEEFSEHMRSSPFNQKVRRCMQLSCKNCSYADREVMEVLARDLGMNDHFAYCVWDLKHDNHGYLLYETEGEDVEVDDLLSGLHLLSFCPIF